MKIHFLMLILILSPRLRAQFPGDSIWFSGNGDLASLSLSYTRMTDSDFGLSISDSLHVFSITKSVDGIKFTLKSHSGFSLFSLDPLNIRPVSLENDSSLRLEDKVNFSSDSTISSRIFTVIKKGNGQFITENEYVKDELIQIEYENNKFFISYHYKNYLISLYLDLKPSYPKTFRIKRLKILFSSIQKVSYNQSNITVTTMIKARLNALSSSLIVNNDHTSYKIRKDRVRKNRIPCMDEHFKKFRLQFIVQ